MPENARHSPEADIVAERVRPETGVEAALVPRLHEGGPGGGIAQVSPHVATGKEPLRAAMDLPHLAKHVQDRFGQREDAFLVPLPDDAKHHLLGVDGRDGQRDGLGDPQSVGIDEREAAAIDGLLERGDQAAAVRVVADVGQPLLERHTDFFWVNSGQ